LAQAPVEDSARSEGGGWAEAEGLPRSGSNRERPPRMGRSPISSARRLLREATLAARLGARFIHRSIFTQMRDDGPREQGRRYTGRAAGIFAFSARLPKPDAARNRTQSAIS
jgi:hypothetical protein